MQDDFKQRKESAFAAIPDSWEKPISLEQIKRRQAKPRLQDHLVGEYIYVLVELGYVAVHIESGTCVYRKTQVGKALAKENVGDYNSAQRNENSLRTEADNFLRHLKPLALGKPVSLWMEIPNKTGRKTTGAKNKKLVVIQVGHAAGLNPELILISIIGGGCAAFNPFAGNAVADLVLAGMPVKLAKELMNKIHLIFKGN